MFAGTARMLEKNLNYIHTYSISMICHLQLLTEVFCLRKLLIILVFFLLFFFYLVAKIPLSSFGNSSLVHEYSIKSRAKYQIPKSSIPKIIIYGKRGSLLITQKNQYVIFRCVIFNETIHFSNLVFLRAVL